MKAIPLESRRVFMMSRFHDMSYTEIAGELGNSDNTVKSHITQSLFIMRRVLQEYTVEK